MARERLRPEDSPSIQDDGTSMTSEASCANTSGHSELLAACLTIFAPGGGRQVGASRTASPPACPTRPSVSRADAAWSV